MWPVVGVSHAAFGIRSRTIAFFVFVGTVEFAALSAIRFIDNEAVNSRLLRMAVLETLKDIGYPVPERTVMLTLSAVLDLRVTYTELREILQELEEARCVLGIRGDDGTVKWSITDEGRGHLLEAKV
ncbi:MAG: hypothetical protein AB1813_03965 [Verrucomicrobiota bacterium]